MDSEELFWLLLALQSSQLCDGVLLCNLDENPVARLHKTLTKVLLCPAALLEFLLFNFAQVFVEVLAIRFLSSFIALVLIVSTSSTFLIPIGGSSDLVVRPSSEPFEEPAALLRHGHLELVLQDVVVGRIVVVCLELIIQTVRFQLTSEVGLRFVSEAMVDFIIVLDGSRVEVVQQVLDLYAQPVPKDNQEHQEAEVADGAYLSQFADDDLVKVV